MCLSLSLCRRRHPPTVASVPPSCASIRSRHSTQTGIDLESPIQFGASHQEKKTQDQQQIALQERRTLLPNKDEDVIVYRLHHRDLDLSLFSCFPCWFGGIPSFFPPFFFLVLIYTAFFLFKLLLLVTPTFPTIALKRTGILPAATRPYSFAIFLRANTRFVLSYLVFGLTLRAFLRLPPPPPPPRSAIRQSSRPIGLQLCSSQYHLVLLYLTLP